MGSEILTFTEVNPDKGTKTKMWSTDEQIAIEFTEVNPDKGTKTLLSFLFQ